METMTPVLLLLCSGFFHVTLPSNRLRAFEFGEKEERLAANNACDRMNGSLVTLYDEEDAEVIQDLVYKHSTEPHTIWLGLHLSLYNVSTWSDGAAVTFNNSRVHVTNGMQVCEAIVNYTWEGFNCSHRKPFMCYRGSNYILIENEPKNWCEAQNYCRKHFTDLVSIRNKTQNDEVIKKGKTFWIGLMHDEWKWEDQGCSTYREWKNIVKTNPKINCTILTNKQLHKTRWDNDVLTLCSKGTVRIKVIRHNLTWEQAYDYCKANHSRLLQIEELQDQMAVEQWLHHTSGDDFWIALRQSRVFGFWIWSDQTVAWNNWRNGQIPEMPMSNNCGVIQNGTYTWRDENCEHLHPFLCEEEISYMRNYTLMQNQTQHTSY